MDRRNFLSETLLGGISAILLGNIKLRNEQGIPNVTKLSENCWRAVILRVDHPNGNKRIYPRSVVEQAVDIFMGFCHSFPSLGQFGMSDGVVNIKDLSHTVDNLHFAGDYVFANIHPLNTPQGHILKTLLVDRPDLVAFRTIGTGNGRIGEIDGNMVIADNFRLLGVHAVSANEATAL